MIGQKTMNPLHSPHGVLAVVVALTAVVGTGAQEQPWRGRDFQVPAWQQWIPTGITVRQGEIVRFRATGEITLNQSGSLRARPGGATNNPFDRDAQLPRVPVGVLIGRVDAPGPFGQRNSRAFLIGDQQSVSMPLDGELLLGINDSTFADNRRTFTVRVESR